MLVAVAVLVPIGEFSKMTYLSVKALRHYHDVGLLEPASIDDSSGYRLYAPEQVPVAQAIRRFRDLDMPIEDIRQVLEAPDVASRNQAIVAHLARMQEQLEKTQATVASLQALLADAPPAGRVERRSDRARRVLAVAARVSQDECLAWLDPAYGELHALVPEPAGPDGALYDEDFFQEDAGLVTAFVPIPDGWSAPADAGRAQLLDLPAVELAVLAHHGPLDDLDRTYGALGTWVTAEGIGLPGPIRETYFDDDSAEVAWPVSPAATV
ncbi:MAG TPA: MerR family transcriptional regulator [Acidimicrobiales bacterium]|nr:MerR family transcriptional regulator [Acidimicrobiales bacterium]